jgi:ABC-type uncharacterized transport system ATPase component
MGGSCLTSGRVILDGVGSRRWATRARGSAGKVVSSSNDSTLPTLTVLGNLEIARKSRATACRP